MPSETYLSTLSELTHLILTAILGGRHYHHPYFTGEEIEAQRWDDLPKLTQLINAKASVQPLTPNHYNTLPFHVPQLPQSAEERANDFA